ncbi:hypothetical protein ZIOFF_021883 [Zingiber officinale]|uniref:HECT-type E3 ubiquitin transferase n=1 Tax=Zingiber officinale TaxID=94328 RepID=A0A8J5H4E2_ZINOF|nr:hypothetical protein ZIOFF_021883 [Zingiber officinale]
MTSSAEPPSSLSLSRHGVFSLFLAAFPHLIAGCRVLSSTEVFASLGFLVSFACAGSVVNWWGIDLVVGSGVAGLRYALEVSKYGSVAIITKAEPQASNTNYAQGGVSAVLCPSDSVESHMQDTTIAGAYLCDEENVKVTDYELIPGGRNIRVIEETKHEYVDLVAEHILTTTIRPQINSFLEGFNELVPKELILIFNDKELELLLSGLPEIDHAFDMFSSSVDVFDWFFFVYDSGWILLGGMCSCWRFRLKVTAWFAYVTQNCLTVISDVFTIRKINDALFVDKSVHMFDQRNLTSGGVGAPVHKLDGHKWFLDKASIFRRAAEDGFLNIWDYEGWGTNEKTLINILAHRNATQRKQIQLAYEELYNESLTKKLESELKGNFEFINLKYSRVEIDEVREYTGYSAASTVIQWFWEVVKSFNKEDMARLLQFVTRTSKVPLEGFKALQGISGPQQFQIHKTYGAPERLPSVHTCFNQLDLPEYSSREQLEERLLLAIHEASEGFGFG